MIAMGLSCNPQILIADEPTTALDVTIQAQIVHLVKEISNNLGMAVVWITHDLGVVAGFAKNVNVMYAGFIVERAAVDHLYANPLHPYTQGLLKSLPRLDDDVKRRLEPIHGTPPNMLSTPVGCPFYVRCPVHLDICKDQNPELKLVTADHACACWLME